MRIFLVSSLCLIFCSACFPRHGAADPLDIKSAGVRGGLSAIAREKYFHQYEAFAVFRLPWALRSSSGFGIATLFDLTAGVLRGEDRSGFIGSAGPAVSLGKPGFPLEMDIGISAAGLSRDTFGNRDFDGNLQFISHVGINYRFSPRVGIGYRLQHMSNAGLNGNGNPGLNMHLLELNWYFSR